MARGRRKSKPSKRELEAAHAAETRERNARAAAAWATASFAPAQAALADDPNKWYRDFVRAEVMRSAFLGDPAPQPDKSKPKRAKRKPDGPAIRRVKQALSELYPPDGRVPDHVPTEKVCARIEAECGWEASWDSVARARGRRKD